LNGVSFNVVSLAKASNIYLASFIVIFSLLHHMVTQKWHTLIIILLSLLALAVKWSSGHLVDTDGSKYQKENELLCNEPHCLCRFSSIFILCWQV